MTPIQLFIIANILFAAGFATLIVGVIRAAGDARYGRFLIILGGAVTVIATVSIPFTAINL